MELKFERGLWRETLRNCQINLSFILVIVGALLALNIAEDVWRLGYGGSLGTAIGWMLLAIAAHATILKGQGGYQEAVDKKVFQPFIFRAFAFALVGIIGSLFTLPFVGDGGLGFNLLLIFPSYGLVEALILSKWGTWLPAVVADGDRSFAAAGRRGKITFSYVCLRLIFCNGFILAFAFTILAIGLSKLNSDGTIWSQSNGLGIGILVLYLALYFAYAFQTVMLATVLSRAYLIAEAKLNKKIPATAAGISEVIYTPA